MNKTVIPYIITIMSFILLLASIYNLDFDNLKTSSFYGIIFNVFLMGFGVYLIYNTKKNV
ncbi:MAG: hypothetical protein KAH07_00215 [Flavobacteriaceae bacterium]|nr:hypothetical protein [Flavobacteriaceae bacterium]